MHLPLRNRAFFAIGALLAASALAGIVHLSGSPDASHARANVATLDQAPLELGAKASEPSRLPPSVVARQGAARGVATSPSTTLAGDDPTARFTTALKGDDDGAKIDAVDALVAGRRVEALPALLAVDLVREPDAAPTIIHAIGKLGRSASSTDKATSAKTLGVWLDEESRRHEVDAVGNVPNLVEALGELGGREAIEALVKALDGGRLELSVQTLVVQTIAAEAPGDARALASVQRFLERVSRMPQTEGIEEELRVEAVSTAKSAVTSLQGG